MRRFAIVFALALVAGTLVTSRSVRVAHADDVLPSITIGSASVIEGDAGSAVVNVPVDLSAPSAVKVTVKYVIHGLDATAASDFAAKSGTVSFVVGGPVSKFISVTVYGDLVPEPDETVLVDLSSPVNATLQSSEGTVTILDDDSDPNTGLQASIGDFNVDSSDSGTHYADLPVTLSQPAPSTVKVYYSISCSDAVNGVDYVYKNTGTLTFLAGQQTKQLKFQILPNQTADDVKTILESISITAGPAQVNDPGSGTGTGTIVDTAGSSPGALPPLPVGALEQESVNAQGELARSVDPSACSPGGDGSSAPSISADGRYVAFASDAVNLVPNDNNGEFDAFVRDRVTGAVERVNVASDGSEAPPWTAGAAWAGAEAPAISRDGRYVTFFEIQTLGGYPGNQFFIHDRQTGTTVPLLTDSLGNPVGGLDGLVPLYMSSDDRYVAFEQCGDSSATVDGSQPLVPTDLDPPEGPQNSGWGSCDVLELDRTTGAYTLVSNPPGGSPSDGHGAAMSGNGRYVAFWSSNPDYVPGDTNNCPDLFVRDMQTGTFERVDLTSAGNQALADSSGTCANFSSFVSLSDDGRYVAFVSSAWNLVGLPDGSGNWQDNGNHAFVRDRLMWTTTMVDPGTGISSSGTTRPVFTNFPSISADGAYVAYYCAWCDLYPVELVTDVATGDIIRASELPDGTQGDGGPNGFGDGNGSQPPTTQALSADGSYLVFSTTSTNLASNDDNNVSDVYVKRVH